jgi:GNAT superfamily N-acetyltransferase
MIRIEKLRPSDYDEMLSLWERAGLPFKPTGRDSRKDMLRQMRLPTAIYLKAVDYRTGRKKLGADEDKNGIGGGRGVMVAVVLGTQDGRKGWVNRLAVLPDYRKRGLGKRLVRELERRFWKMGLGIFTCQIEDWNTVSLKVFKRLGYKLHRDIFYLTKRKVKGI